MKKAVILPVLVLVIMTSGCNVPGLDFLGLGGPQVMEYENDILIIKDIQAVPQVIAPDQQVRIISYIENVGKDTIPQETGYVMVELYDYCRGLFSIDHVRCPPGADKYTRDGAEIGCNIKKILPGQILEVDWILHADSNIKLETRCPVDGMKVLVRYPYKTTSLTTITVISPEELQRQLEEGTFKRKDSYIVAGQGPIKPFLYVEDQQPISQESKTTVFALQVENKGSGFLADSSVPIPQENIDITLPKGFKPSNPNKCNFESSGDVYRIKDQDGLRLIYGKSPKLLCEVDIPQQEEGYNIAKEATFTATVDIEYEYEFRDSVNVLVKPKM